MEVFNSLLSLTYLICLASGTCDIGWTALGGSCYVVGRIGLAVSSAATACSLLGGSLVSIRSEEENNFVRNLASGAAVWLSASQATGTWTWAEGDKLTATPPGSDLSQGEICLVMLADGSWHNGEGCGAALNFVCEKSVQSQPETTMGTDIRTSTNNAINSAKTSKMKPMQTSIFASNSPSTNPLLNDVTSVSKSMETTQGTNRSSSTETEMSGHSYVNNSNEGQSTTVPCQSKTTGSGPAIALVTTDGMQIPARPDDVTPENWEKMWAKMYKIHKRACSNCRP